MKKIVFLLAFTTIMLMGCSSRTVSSTADDTVPASVEPSTAVSSNPKDGQTAVAGQEAISSDDGKVPVLPPPEEGSTVFTVPVLDENGMCTGAVMRFSCKLPETWREDTSAVFLDDNIVVEWKGAYPSDENTRQQLFATHAKAEVTSEVDISGMTAQYYHMQSEVSEGGMTGIKNELFYYLNIDDKIICVTFYPSMGVGGISSQREEWEACLATLRPVAADRALCADFSLKKDAADAQTMYIGDTVGTWTLTDLQIRYDQEKKVEMLEAFFAGNTTLRGTISRSLLVEDGYDFVVSEHDEEKMPHYTDPAMQIKDTMMFMLDIPKEIQSTLSLSQGEQKECEITISTYRFIFAYMTAPASATVVELKV